MVRRLILIFGAFASLVSQLPAQTARATVAIGDHAVALHLSRASTSPTIDTIPAHTALGEIACASSWCSVSYNGHAGFLRQSQLRTVTGSHRAAPSETGGGEVISSGRGYTNSRGNYVPSPARTRDGRPPAGASAQCRDGTFSFSQSRRGTCSHHGGVATWL